MPAHSMRPCLVKIGWFLPRLKCLILTLPSYRASNKPNGIWNGQFVEAIDVWLVGRPTSLCTSAAEVASPKADGMLLYYLASAYPIL